jgi:hypothetical protein
LLVEWQNMSMRDRDPFLERSLGPETGTGPRRSVDLRLWFWRVLSWDALLPAVILVVPGIVQQIVPNRRGFLEIISVALPVGAFVFRFYSGKRQIALNYCSDRVRLFQFGVFFIGILPLALIDCFLILSHLMPKGALFAAGSDRIMWGILFGIYLMSMIVAMYPGRTAVADDPRNMDFGENVS